MMQECMPPMPGGGVNVTVSIDLGGLLAGPQQCMPPKPSTPLTCAPPPPPPECEPGKTVSFLDGGCFGEAMGNVAGKFGHGPKKHSDREGCSFSGEDKDDKDNRNETEKKKSFGPKSKDEENEEDEKKKPW